MEFALDDVHVDLASSIDALLAKADTPSVIRAWNVGDTPAGEQLFQRLSETGANTLLLAEEYDGMGATAVEAMVALEVLGKHAVPGPVVETIMVAPRVVNTAELAQPLTEGQFASAAVTGVSPYAPDAHVAARVFIAQDGAASLAAESTFDRGQGVASVDRSRTLFSPTVGDTVGDVCTNDVINHGALGTAAQALGLAQAMLEMSTEYALQRKQFGNVIGGYQAIKHKLSEVAIAIEMARPLMWAAAVSLSSLEEDGCDEAGAKATLDASAAKIACCDAAYTAARTALQVHGGIGYTMEHDLGLWLTKARALQNAWGTQDYHRGRVLAAIEGA